EPLAAARLPFDRYQRYALAARVVRAAVPAGPVRVLEVGANVHGDLGRFLPGANVVRLDLTAPADGQPFVRGDGAAIPFRTGAFDLVLALDVLEHVPAAHRRAFVAEAVRVASRGVVIAAPFQSIEVESHEAGVNE